MGDKPTISGKLRGPGPGRYQLPSSCGKIGHDPTKRCAPSHSFGNRTKLLYTKDISPGPKHAIDSKITRKGMDGTPQYSLAKRFDDPNLFKTPAPGAYSPEKCHPQGEKHAPVYSMAARTRYRKRDTVPAPNSYSLPTLHGPSMKLSQHKSSHSYTMRPKTDYNDFAKDLSKTPGAGSYNTPDPNTTKKKSALYTMKGRSYMPGDSTQKPGPGAHRPEDVLITKRQAPRASLGIRHSEFITPLIIQVAD